MVLNSAVENTEWKKDSDASSNCPNQYCAVFEASRPGFTPVRHPWSQSSCTAECLSSPLRANSLTKSRMMYEGSSERSLKDRDQFTSRNLSTTNIQPPPRSLLAPTVCVVTLMVSMMVLVWAMTKHVLQMYSDTPITTTTMGPQYSLNSNPLLETHSMNSKDPLDALHDMQTVSSRMRWPAVVLHSTLATLALVSALLVWSFARTDPLPGPR
ncbi:hypothetical protein Hamer_G002162 [Homarus americanus]|uniref:Uncharacterized protein n=1 Tax=Homarus americanus TaxID=6706 RepID=A0A8J5JX38_HOMAM|nr:hypothetical protein Hamer_G002162 [Homarus americanus]